MQLIGDLFGRLKFLNKVIIELCFPNWCSGDVDGIVPTTGTRYWLAELNLPIQTAWYPWNHSSQVMYRLSTLCFYGNLLYTSFALL